MNEINEQDLQAVTGGLSAPADIDEVNSTFRIFQRRLCASCANLGKNNGCVGDLLDYITDEMKRGRTPDLRCPRRP